MDFWSIALFETLLIATVSIALGLVKLPKEWTRKKLTRGSPWGYYKDNVPKPDGDFYDENTDFLHNTGTKYVGTPGLGIYGELQAHGFGEGWSDW